MKLRLSPVTAPAYLLDGHSLAFRAFHAIPDTMAAPSGQPTNAVFGFFSMVARLVEDLGPGSLLAAFDRPEPTFRHQQLATYKGTRAETPASLPAQVDIIKELLEALGVPVVDMAGFEADDVLATVASMQRDLGQPSVIVTGDRDALQLVEDPYIKVLYTRRGISDYSLYDEAGVQERTGVLPSQYPDLAAMRGDPSDNLPGVPGIGEKTAAKLLQEYGDVPGILANLDRVAPRVRGALESYSEQLRRDVELIRLIRNLPIEAAPAPIGGPDLDRAHDLFLSLGLRTPWGRLTRPVIAQPASPPDRPSAELSGTASVVCSPDEFAAALTDLRPGSESAIVLHVRWPDRPGRSVPEGVAATVPGAGRVLVGPGEWLTDPKVVRALADLVSDRVVHCHGVKDLVYFLLGVGLELPRVGIDPALAGYLLDPGESSYPLVALADRFLATSLPEVRPPLDGLADRAAGFDHLAIEAEAVARLAEELDRRLSNDGLSELYYRIEAPLSKTLAKMERAGIGVDREQLLQVMADLEQESAETERRIHALAGHPFKISSTQQLQKVLFDELGLPHQRKTKTGYSTSAGALEPLRGSHAIVEEVLRYREVEKLRSTYGESLLKEVQPDGRIRATFNQTVARTGRLSSDHPNLHNIPVRTAEGRRIRRAFVPRDGWTLLAADYEQIELRVIAHLSGDPGLVHAFAAGEDVHRATAARVFEVPPNEVTFAQRNRAKMVAYGLAYGMEPYGLAQRLAIPVDEADEIMKAFFAAFPAISGYMASVVAEARSRGYTVTALGRRRPIPELSSANRHVRQAGERQAMNAGVQGLAADVFKLALVRLDQALEAEQLASRIVLQVHDEVVLEVEPSERHRVGAMTDRIMRAAGEEAGLTVPLAVSLGWGQTWADAKA